MRRRFCTLTLKLAAAFGLIAILFSQNPNPPSPSLAQTSPTTLDAAIANPYRHLPISFEPNCGQTDPAVSFLSRNNGYEIFLTGSEVLLALGAPATPNCDTPVPSGYDEDKRPTGLFTSTVRIILKGANASAAIDGLDELPGKSNYFIGKDPSKWHTDIPNYAKVRYEGIYPGVDLVFYGNNRQLENDFIVAPGADFAVIRFAFEGARHLHIDSAGDLVLETAAGEVRQRKPLVYQDSNGVKQTLQGNYLLSSEGEVGFQIPSYDPSVPLVIDPVLSYSTFLGGSNGDQGRAITIDCAGNAYVTGATASLNFPVTMGAFQTTFGGPGAILPYDVFVTKLNSIGSAVLYSTYFGGRDYELPASIAVDEDGNAYTTGSVRSSRFPYHARGISNRSRQCGQRLRDEAERHRLRAHLLYISRR